MVLARGVGFRFRGGLPMSLHANRASTSAAAKGPFGTCDNGAVAALPATATMATVCGEDLL